MTTVIFFRRCQPKGHTMTLQDATVYITGASRGLGLASYLDAER